MKKLLLASMAFVSMLVLSGCSPQDRDGWFYHTFVKPMDVLLKAIYDVVGSWGLAIIVITLIMRLIIMPFMLKNYKNQREARIGQEKAKPELDVIRAKMEELKKEEVRAITKEDKLRIRTAQMEVQREQWNVMKKYNANPMSMVGCLPPLIQAPFLTGIYFTLINPLYSAGIIESTFLGYFNLGTRSYVLPVIAFIVYAVQTKLTLKWMPQNTQPGQEAIAQQMQLMQWFVPIMIAGISFYVAGAVAVYYIVGGLFLIGQTYIGHKLYPAYKPQKEEQTNFDPNKVTLVSNKKKRK